jgi:hypothetical protein
VNLTVSPQIKILALVGLLAAVGLAASMFVLGGSSKKTTTVVHAPAKMHTPVRHASKPRTAAPATSASKQATKTHAKPHKKGKPAAFRGNAV